jgi:predicted dehydrogenase
MSRIALVGCGKHMKNTLVRYLRQLDECDVEVCVDIDEAAAQTVQRLSRAHRCATRIEEIDVRVIDAAIIALPPAAAYQVTSYLIKQGVACFVEKPPASTSEEIETLVELAREREVHVQVGFNFRFAEALVALHAHIVDGIKDPCIATIEFRSEHPSGPEWGRDDPIAAWLYHNGVHALDLLLWLVGDVQRVDAYIARMLAERFTLVTLMEHSNHSISTLRMGTLTDRFDLRAEISTSEGHQFYLSDLSEVVMPLHGGKVAGEVLYRARNLDHGWGRAGYGPELRYFLDHYRDGKSSSPSLLDALKASKLCDAIMRSLQERSGSMGDQMIPSITDITIG